jgi:hypothetical protein
MENEKETEEEKQQHRAIRGRDGRKNHKIFI